MSIELMSTPTVKRSNSYRKALRKSGVYYDPNDDQNPYQDDDRFVEPKEKSIDFQPIGSKKRFVKRQQQQQMRNILLSSNNDGKPVDPDDPHENDEKQILMNANYPNGEEQQQQPNQLEDPLAMVMRQEDHFHMDTFQQQNERIVLNGRLHQQQPHQSDQTSGKNIKDPCDEYEDVDVGGTTIRPPTNTINWKHLFCLFCCCNYCCCLLSNLRTKFHSSSSPSSS